MVDVSGIRVIEDDPTRMEAFAGRLSSRGSGPQRINKGRRFGSGLRAM